MILMIPRNSTGEIMLLPTSVLHTTSKLCVGQARSLATAATPVCQLCFYPHKALIGPIKQPQHINMCTVKPARDVSYDSRSFMDGSSRQTCITSRKTRNQASQACDGSIPNNKGTCLTVVCGLARPVCISHACPPACQQVPLHSLRGVLLRGGGSLQHPAGR